MMLYQRSIKSMVERRLSKLTGTWLYPSCRGARYRMSYETRFNPDDPDLTLKIASTVAILSNRPMEQLPRLYPVVDISAIEKTFHRGTSDTQIFTFSYSDYLITIGDDGTITFKQKEERKKGVG